MYNYTCEYIYRTEGVICTELKELTYKNAYRMERVDILTETIELIYMYRSEGVNIKYTYITERVDIITELI